MRFKLLTLLLIMFCAVTTSMAQRKIDLLLIEKSYDKALQEIDKELAANPSSELFYKKGVVYKNLQDYQPALDAFMNGLHHDSNNIIMLEETAECFSILGNNRDAVAYYEKALQVEPNNLPLAGKLGRVHINLDDYQTAYKVFTDIYEKDSTNVYWNKQLAYCSFRVFQREKARDIYEKVLEANPRDHGTYINLIHCYNWKKEANEITYNYLKQPYIVDEMPGVSVFIKNEQVDIFHTYSTYSRGLDILNGAYNLIDLSPKGRDEDDGIMHWLRRHDQYE